MARPRKDRHFVGTTGRRVCHLRHKTETEYGMVAMPFGLFVQRSMQKLYVVGNLENFLSCVLTHLFGQRVHHRAWATNAIDNRKLVQAPRFRLPIHSKFLHRYLGDI